MYFNGKLSKQTVALKSNANAKQALDIFSDQSNTQKTIQKNQGTSNSNKLIVPGGLNERRPSLFNKKNSQQNYSPEFRAEITKGSSQQKSNQATEDEINMIQNYLGSHNKYKTYFKSKKYKKIYHQLSKQIPLQKSYFVMYMEDKLFALNKHIKISLVHKQTSFGQYLGPYFQAGKKLIKQFYQNFLVDNQLYKGTKKVNSGIVSNNQNGMSSSPNQFFYITITFLHELAIFYRSKSQRKQAEKYYLANLKLIYSILQSSTSSCRLRRKISQNLISFSAFLIQSRQLVKAQHILHLALKNCINLIGIVQAKLLLGRNQRKQTSNTDAHLSEKNYKKTNRKLKQAFQFLLAVYLNSAVVFQLQNKEQLAFLALNQIKYIEQILYKRYSIKGKISEIIKKPKQAFDYHCQKIHMIKCYFDMGKVIKDIQQEKEMNQNVNTGIFGLKNLSDDLNSKTKTICELFFNQKSNSWQNKKKKSGLVFTSKIALIEYDKEIQVQNKNNNADKYVINTKKTNGNQISTVYNQTKASKQRRKLTYKKDQQDTSKDKRKKSKFYSHYENISKQQNFKNDEIAQNKQIEDKRTFKKLDTNKGNIKHSQKNQDNDFKFLDSLVDSEFKSKNQFFYGQQFIENYDSIQKGGILFNKSSQFKSKSKSTYSNSLQNKKKIKYSSKNEIESIFGKQNVKNHHLQSSKNENRKNLVKKRRQIAPVFKHHQQNRLSSVHIVKQQINTHNQNQIVESLQNQRGQQRKRSLTSMKNGPMSYKQIMTRIQATQNEFVKRDYIEKNSIYRLKCRSQNISKKKYSSKLLLNGQAKRKYSDIFNLVKNQNERQVIKFKLEKNQKNSYFLEDNNKSNNLLKKGAGIGLTNSNQSGVRLLKRIIFKHKKILKIVKPDLFVNYNKHETGQQDLKLVERESLLMVQYNMSQEETRARIKQNMKQLIIDNLRNSEQNQKRVQKLNKAINQYEKNKRQKEFNTKMKQSYDSGGKTLDTFSMIPNSNFFSSTFKSPFSQISDKNSNSSQNLIKNILHNQMMLSKNQFSLIGLEGQKVLTANKISNPNLFLSSIKFTESQKIDKKNEKTLMNLNDLRAKKQLINQDQDEGWFSKGIIAKEGGVQNDQLNYSKSFCTMSLNRESQDNILSENERLLNKSILQFRPSEQLIRNINQDLVLFGDKKNYFQYQIGFATNRQ